MGIGGGSAGCILAHRLSADPAVRVELIVASADTPPDAVPKEILDSYPPKISFSNQVNSLKGVSSRMSQKKNKSDDCAARALDPALKGKVCRAPDQAWNRDGPDSDRYLGDGRCKNSIGFRIWDAWQVFSAESMYVGLVVIATLGFLQTLNLNEVGD